MSDIKAIYRNPDGSLPTPGMTADQQCPGALRYQLQHPTLGTLLVDALNGAPTQAEIDSVVAGTFGTTQDQRAGSAVDAEDRFWFEVNFDQENRVRALEGKAAITRTQYRSALINLWKTLNP